MTSTRKVFGNSIIYAISSLISGAVVFIMMPIYTRVLSADEYGIYSIINSLALLFTIPCMFGLDSATSKFHFSLNDEEKKIFNGTMVTTVFAFCILFTGLFVIFGEQISLYFADGLLFIPYVIIGIGVAAFKPIYALFQSMLQVRQKSIYYLINSVSFLFVNLCLNLLFLFVFNLGALSLLYGMLFTHILFFVVSIFEIYRKKYAKFTFSFKHFKMGIKYSLPLVPGPLFASLATYLVKLFIKKYLGLGDVGIYDVAIQFGLIIGVAQLAVNRAVFPYAYEKYNASQQNDVSKLGQVLMVFYFLLCAFVAIFSKEIIQIFSGKEYQIASRILPIISIAYCVKALNYYYDNNILYNLKGPKFVLINNISANIILIVLSITLLPYINLYAPAVGLFVSYLYSTVFSYFVAKKMFYVNYNEKGIIIDFFIVILISFAGIIFNYFIGLNEVYVLNILYKVFLFLITVAYFIFRQRKNLKNILIYLKNKKETKTNIK